ncbi:hypothetical protein KBC03_00100 [Patescibacteria group bacterium]|nr:hypothetical protein [Patescibacteria group bacterium]
MSETKKLFAAGVFKVDYKSAGYKDLYELAQERKKDENFYELIVRRVAEQNYGIQFVYIDHNLVSAEKVTTDSYDNKMTAYKKQLHDKYGKGFYAWDYYATDEGYDDNLIVLKSDLPN